MKEFTNQERIKLRKNPYVKRVTAMRVSFTTAFKEKFWEQYQAGKHPTEILMDLGFDPEVLGTTRIKGIRQHIQDAVRSGDGFNTVRQPRRVVKKIDDTDPSNALVRVQHELEYVKQEVEFIKKIMLVDREANRKCSSKDSRASNLESSMR